MFMLGHRFGTQVVPMNKGNVQPVKASHLSCPFNAKVACFPGCLVLRRARLALFASIFLCVLFKFFDPIIRPSKSVSEDTYDDFVSYALSCKVSFNFRFCSFRHLVILSWRAFLCFHCSNNTAKSLKLSSEGCSAHGPDTGK